MICKNCGAEIAEGIKFCTECGAAVEEVAEAPAESTAAESTEAPAENAAAESAEAATENVAEESTEAATEATEKIEKVEAEIVSTGAVIPPAASDTSSSDTGNSYQNTTTNTYNTNQPLANDTVLSAQATSIICYFTWIGWIVAFLAGDRENAKFHLNQALVIKLFGLLGAVPVVGWLWSIFIFVAWIIGLIYAIEQENKEVPLIGALHIL